MKSFIIYDHCFVVTVKLQSYRLTTEKLLRVNPLQTHAAASPGVFG